MEGHIFSSLIKKEEKNKFEILKPEFPLISLLISGGHTELIFSKSEGKYKKIGESLDDAVGEAYDKSARLLGISYPGGPEISKLAENFKIKNGAPASLSLPRPMLNKNNFDFSFSGLKTAVLYLVKNQEKNGKINKKFKEELSAEFENSVSEVLTKKTLKAIKKYGAKSLIIGGGVSANKRLRKDFKNFEKMSDTFGIAPQKLSVFLPNKKYTGDNALMIVVAGYFNFKNKKFKKNIKKVDGNLELK
jgi:N6-L-threonylcarbamoyladenine synthase